MNRTANAVVNLLLTGAVVYAIGRLMAGHRRGLQAGAVTGFLSGAVAWVVYGRFEDGNELGGLREATGERVGETGS